MDDYGSDGFCENYDSGPYDPNNNDQDNDGWWLIDCCRDGLSFRLPGTIHADGCASFGPRQINERYCLKDCPGSVKLESQSLGPGLFLGLWMILRAS